MVSAFPATVRMLTSRSRSAFCLSTSSMPPEMSTATTSRHRRAMARVKMPVPAPISSTRSAAAKSRGSCASKSAIFGAAGDRHRRAELLMVVVGRQGVIEQRGRQPAAGRHSPLHDLFADQAGQRHDLQPLLLQAADQRVEFAEKQRRARPRRRDVVEGKDVARGDLFQHLRREAGDPQVSHVRGAAAEVDAVHPLLEQDPPEVGVGDPHRGPEGQRDDAEPSENVWAALTSRRSFRIPLSISSGR